MTRFAPPLSAAGWMRDLFSSKAVRDGVRAAFEHGDARVVITDDPVEREARFVSAVMVRIQPERLLERPSSGGVAS